MTLKTLLIIIVLAVAGYFAYVKFVDTEKVGEKVGEVADDPYRAGELEFTGGRWDRVVENYTVALKKDPGNSKAVEAEYRIAKALQKLNRDSEALAAYRAFLAKHPDHPDKETIRGHIERYEAMNVK